MHEGWILKLWAYCYSKSEEDCFGSINWLPPDLCIQTSRLWYTNKTIPQSTCIYLVPCFTIGILQPHSWHTRLCNCHTYALVTFLLIAYMSHITSYHEPYALVHVSTCTCTFQCALVHLYMLTHSLGHYTPHCAYWWHTIPRSSTQWASLVILINLFSMYTQFCIPYHSS